MPRDRRLPGIVIQRLRSQRPRPRFLARSDEFAVRSVEGTVRPGMYSWLSRCVGSSMRSGWSAAASLDRSHDRLRRSSTPATPAAAECALRNVDPDHRTWRATDRRLRRRCRGIDATGTESDGTGESRVELYRRPVGPDRRLPVEADPRRSRSVVCRYALAERSRRRAVQAGVHPVLVVSEDLCELVGDVRPAVLTPPVRRCSATPSRSVWLRRHAKDTRCESLCYILLSDIRPEAADIEGFTTRRFSTTAEPDVGYRLLSASKLGESRGRLTVSDVRVIAVSEYTDW